jgi:hypothetical protein
MAKTPSQKLFQIIHHLTPAEKRYFSLRYAKSQEEDNKYIKLFNVIEKMETLNEAALQKAIYGTKKVEGKKFSELKNYCYQLILSTLQDYDNENSVEYKLKNQLLQIKSLYKRAFYEDAQIMIEKTFKLAIQYEQFETILELLRWKKQIAYAKGDIDFFDKELESIANQEKTYLEKIQNIQFYKNSFHRVYTAIRKYRLLDNKELQVVLQEVSDAEEFSGIDKAISFSAQIIYLRVWSLCSYALRDNERFYQHGKLLLELMLSKPELLKEDISEYISANSNFVVACMLTERTAETMTALENFKLVTPKTNDDKLKVHRQYYQGIFELCQNTGDFDKGYKMMHLHLKERQQFDLQVFNTQAFYYAYFYMSFGSGHYDEALDYLNEWLSSERTVDRMDLQALAQLLSLIIHFEKGNTILLESLLRSTARYLNKRSKVTEFEREIIKFIRKASVSINRKELRELAENVKTSLVALSEDSSQGSFTQYFDFVAWIESKMTSQSFATIVQQKFQSKQNN